MNAGEMKVVGIKYGYKNGNQSTVLYLEKPYEDYELKSQDYECQGFSTCNEYFRRKITDVKIGDIIEIIYRKNSFDGKAMAVGVVVKNVNGKK